MVVEFVESRRKSVLMRKNRSKMGERAVYLYVSRERTRRNCLNVSHRRVWLCEEQYLGPEDKILCVP